MPPHSLNSRNGSDETPREALVRPLRICTEPSTGSMVNRRHVACLASTTAATEQSTVLNHKLRPLLPSPRRFPLVPQPRLLVHSKSLRPELGLLLPLTGSHIAQEFRPSHKPLYKRKTRTASTCSSPWRREQKSKVLLSFRSSLAGWLASPLLRTPGISVDRTSFSALLA